MQFLIDGYNLLHAIGLAPKAGGMSLERSRLRLIEWLAAELGKDVDDLCVVFDAVNDRGQEEHFHRGIRMRFSHGETADDLIERLIRNQKVPNQLTVVSNDHRLQQAARRHGCISLSCGEYVDWLIGRKKEERSTEPPASSSDKPDSTTEGEMAEWLKKFGAEGG